MKARVINDKNSDKTVNIGGMVNVNTSNKRKLVLTIVLNAMLVAAVISLKFLIGFSVLTAFTLWFLINTLIAFGTYIIKSNTSNTKVIMWTRLAIKLPKPTLSENDRSSLIVTLGINFVALCITLVIRLIIGF